MKMNRKKWSALSMMVLLSGAALCLIFGGTVREKMLPQVEWAVPRVTRLQTAFEFPCVWDFENQSEFKLETSRPVRVDEVLIRRGQNVTAGEKMFSLSIRDAEEMEEELRARYTGAWEAFEAIRAKTDDVLTPEASEYVAAVRKVSDAQAEAELCRIKAEALLPEEYSVWDFYQEEVLPEELSADAAQSVEDWKAALEAVSAAQAEKDALPVKSMEAETLEMLTERMEILEEMDAAEADIRAYYAETEKLKSVNAPQNMAVARVTVSAGQEAENGDVLAYFVPEGTEVVLTGTPRAEDFAYLNEGSYVSVEMNGGTYITQISAIRPDGEGRKRVILLKSAEMPAFDPENEDEMTAIVTIDSKEMVSFVPAACVHEDAKGSFVFAAENGETALGDEKITVRRVSVTKVTEADGEVMVKENLGEYRLAVNESKELTDGDRVLSY